MKNVDGGWKTYSSVFGSNIETNVETTTNDLGETVIEDNDDTQVDSVLDVTGLSCPMPIVRLKKGIEALESEQVLELHATDKGVLSDLTCLVKKCWPYHLKNRTRWINH